MIKKIKRKQKKDACFSAGMAEVKILFLRAQKKALCHTEPEKNNYPGVQYDKPGVCLT